MSSPVQAVPSSVNCSGTGLVAARAPAKPMSTDPSLSRAVFHSRPVALTCVPDCDHCAPQPLVTV